MNCHLAYDILSSINQNLTVKRYFDVNGGAYQDILR